jgi:hypothetical protein
MQPASAPRGNSSTAPAAGSADGEHASEVVPTPTPSAEQVPPGPPTGPAAGPASTEATDESLLDNGLWPGEPVGGCCPNCCNGWGPPPDWYVDQGANVLARDRPRTNPLSFGVTLETVTINSLGSTINVPLPASLLNVHNVGFTGEPGDYTTIGHYVCRDCGGHDDFLEFTFWGFNSWAGNAAVAPGILPTQQTVSLPNAPGLAFTVGRLNTQFKLDNINLNGLFGLVPFNQTLGVVGFDGADTQYFSESSEIENFEWNFRMRPRPNPNQLVLHPDGRWRLECEPGWETSYLFGLRFINFHDACAFHSQGTTGTFVGGTQVDSTPVSGDYNIQAQNYLLGLQVGADIDYRACKWSAGVHTKIGPCVNFSHDDKDIINNPGDLAQYSLANFDNHYSQNAQHASMIGEVSLAGTYTFRPNLVAHASFDFMWITGLAMSADQFTWDLPPNGPGQVDANDTIATNGTLFCYGPKLSLEWRW